MNSLQLLTSYKPQHKDNVLEVVTQAVDSGVPVIQFCWDGDDRETFLLAEKIKRITEAAKAKLVVNNRVDVALAVNADAVHLGKFDAPVSIIKPLLPKEMLIGYTVSTINELLAAEKTHVDYYGVGPVFDSITKPGTSFGLKTLQQIRQLTRKPIVAIGGITIDNIESVKNLGIEGYAVIGAVYNNDDIATAITNLISKLNSPE